MSKHAAFSPETQIIDSEKGSPVVHKEYDGASMTLTGTRGTENDSEAGAVHRQEHARATRRLLLKLDLCILPFAVLLYLSAYLDRGNIANARLQGLEKEVLRGDDSNYSFALTCFFITYITLSIPGTLLAKQINPSYSIAFGALTWSIAATCQAAATSPAGLYVCRLFVGVGEAMFGQAMAFHLSLWYTKKDLAKRIGLFISAGALSGAFGGLIAFGVAHIKHSKIQNWRILFLIEGIPSLFLAICVALFMPSRPERSRLLSEDERTLCLTRLNEQNTQEDSNLGIDWKGVRRTMTDPKAYLIAVGYSCMNMTLGSVGGFLPTIIKNLGYTNADAQLYTVPVYVVALVFMLIMTTFSDRYQTRGLPAASVFLIGVIGWVILLTVNGSKHASHAEMHVRYFGCMCIVTAGYTNIPIIMAWVSGNSPNQSQRAAGLGMLNSIGQCLSVAASYLFPSKEGPQYRKGCIINIAFQILGLCIMLLLTTYFRRENKKRDEAEGGTPPVGTHLETFEKFDKAPGFRYVP